MTVRLSIGDPAPAFTLLDQNGATVTLEQYRGRHLVVYFYPGALTPGCTTQSCNLRDAQPDFAELHTAIIGVSPDTPAKQHKFDQTYGLRFPLLADEDHAVAIAWGVWGEKSLYGKRYLGILRSAFLVDPTGLIAAAFYEISPKDTVPKLLKALAHLQH